MEPESPIKKRFIRNKNKGPKVPPRLPRNQIAINLTDCKFSVIRYVASKVMGWKVIDDDPENFNCDIIWNDTACNQHIMGSLKPYMKINHFPGVHLIARKNFMAYHLNKMKKRFPEHFDFYPETYCLPSDKNILAKEFEGGKKKTFIVKPEAGSQGRGIYLVRKLEDAPLTDNFVVQRYIKNPMTIDGYKFDMRIYVLVTSITPLTIYLYKEGLGRLATEKYSKPTDSNMDDVFKHLTNYSINKFSKKFEYSKDPNMAVTGHKRSLASVKEYIDKNGGNSTKIWDEIKKCVIKLFTSIHPIMKHIYTSSQPDDITGAMCFEILGLDILLTDEGKPLLIEVNHAPSFNSDTPYDFKTKSELLTNMFQMLNISIEERRAIQDHEKKKLEKRLITGKREKTSQEEKDKIRQEYRSRMNEKIKPFIKDFELLTDPSTFTEPYDEMMAYAAQLHRERTGVSNQKPKIIDKEKEQPIKKTPLTNSEKKLRRAQTQIKSKQIVNSINRLYRKNNTTNLEAKENREIQNKKFLKEKEKPKQEVLKTNVVNLELPDMFINFK